jgi:peptidoglycan hydrolase CwlO-like protein
MNGDISKKEFWNNLIIAIFSTAILGLGTSHIYVLNKLATFEVQINNNQKSVDSILEKLDKILEKTEKTNGEIISLKGELKNKNE